MTSYSKNLYNKIITRQRFAAGSGKDSLNNDAVTNTIIRCISFVIY